MKPTTDTELLGEAPASAKKGRKASASPKASKAAPKAAKEPKAGKTEKAPKPAKAEKPAKEPKAPKEPKVKKERKVDDRVAVDQTPTEVKRANELKPASIELLVHLHENTKEATTMAEIATQLKTDTKSVSARATSLIAAGLVAKDEKAKTLDIVGKRHEGFPALFTAITDLTKKNGSMPTSAKIGQALWADPKKPGNKDTVRYGRAAGRLLQGAFRMGIIKQFTQPRRKFSDAKVRKLFAVVE